MPRDGSGNYALPTGYFVNAGDVVLPAQHNPALEDIAAALSGSLPVNGTKAMSGNLTLAADPSSALHAATKQYVDATVNPRGLKTTVKACANVNITLSGTQTIDGVALVAGDRVLLPFQTTTTQNGIYVVAAGAWTRATDFDAWSEIPTALIAVEQGTVNGDTLWLCTSNTGGTVGSTPIGFLLVGPYIARAGPGPCNFSATKSGAQSGIAVNTWTKVTCPNEAYDNGNSGSGFYDTTTSRWTPPVGYFVLNGLLQLTGGVSDANSTHFVGFAKNGVITTVPQQQQSAGNNNLTVGGMCVFAQTTATDYWELWYQGSGTTTKTISTAVFQGFML